MRPKNEPQQDPLHDFFTSEWEASLLDTAPLSPRFSETVLTKIKANKYKERLFNLGCLSIALAGIVGVLLFVYPGYKQLHTVTSDVASYAADATRSFIQLFKLPSEPGFISIPLLVYISLLTAVLLGLDLFLRKRREAHTIDCL